MPVLESDGNSHVMVLEQSCDGISVGISVDTK